MKRSVKLWWKAGLIASLAACVSGCETVQDYSLCYKLWNREDFRKWNEPAPDPRLALFNASAPTNWLVVYDAFSEKQSVVKRQAYYLQPNLARIKAGKAPRLVSPAAAGLSPVAVLAAKATATNRPIHLTNYALVAESGREFTLHLGAQPAETFPLPVYSESSGTILRVAFTPAAVVADTAMIGLVAGFVALYGACVSGFVFSP